MSDPSQPSQPEPQPGAWPSSPPPAPPGAVPPPPPPPDPAGAGAPDPGVPGPLPASFTVSVPPQVHQTAQKGIDTFALDPGSWCSAAVLLGVGLTVLGDIVLSAYRFSLSVPVSNGGARVRFVNFTGFASFGVAVALLLAAGLALAVKASSPASFRKPVLLAAAATSMAIAGFAVLRALTLLTFGHSYGFAGFLDALAAVPIALVAGAFGFVAARGSGS